MRGLIVTAILTLSAHAAWAQSLPAADRLAQLKTRLRNLVTAQEKYWADHGTYTTDVAALGVFRRPKPGEPRDSIWVQVIQAGGRSWTGRAVHVGDRVKSCVIYVGLLKDFPSPPTTDGSAKPAEKEGDPVCDAP